MEYAELCSALPGGDDLWCQVFSKPGKESRPALFLDRDGVIVELIPYLHRVEDVALIAGAVETIAAANRQGVPVVVITNQAGIGRGYYGWKEFQEVQEFILIALRNAGARVDGVFACPHHPDATGRYFHSAHPARKPGPGMLLRAAEMLRIDLARSWIVGDRSGDLLAGRSAGLQGGVLVKTGLGQRCTDTALALRQPGFDVMVAESIGVVGELIPLLARGL
jgi:D-glycero-D-manno-heptose 1,7-bisphosphate phosphatase